MVNRGLNAREEQLSNQLCFVLVMLLRGRALDVAYHVESGEGLETYRKLYDAMRLFIHGLLHATLVPCH